MAQGQEYECSKGHGLYDPKGSLKACLGFIKGSPCKGTLKKVGAGSRTTNKGEQQ